MIAGNTVRLRATFATFSGNLSDIENPVLNIMNGVQIVDTLPLTEANHVSIGVYEIDYTPERKDFPILFSFEGTLEGSKIVGTHEEPRELT